MFPNTYFSKAKKYWYMGKYHDWSEGGMHPMVHALHYGTSVFEGIRAYPTPRGPAVFRLPEHIDRFIHSASVLRMTPPYARDEMIRLVKDVVRENGLEACYIRPIMFYSYGNLGLVPKACPVELVIGAWEWDAYLGEKAGQGVSVYILPWRRIHRTQLDMSAKLGGAYVQSTICGLEARAQGCDEAVFLNLEGRVAEGPGENIFIVQGKTLHTNDRSESILQGITRTSVLEMARDLGYKTRVAPITKEEFFAADEAFFTGTAVEITSIVKGVDASDPQAERREFRIGAGKPGPATLAVGRAFREVVSGRDPRHDAWLSYAR